MEAIVEMIGALIGALIQSLIGLIEAVAALIGIVLEFAFLALTHGIGAASRQYKLRQQERAERWWKSNRLLTRRRGARHHQSALNSLQSWARFCFRDHL